MPKHNLRLIFKSSSVDANIIIADIRGFSNWVNDPMVTEKHIKTMIQLFYSLIYNYFSTDFIKPLGDGVLIIRIGKSDPKTVLQHIFDVFDKFKKMA